MPALLLRLQLQCAGDIEMNTEPVTTPTPTNCLHLMQYNTNGISGKITELLIFHAAFLLPKILTHIPFYFAQHGFRPKHSTCTALSTITVDIASDISSEKPAHRTELVAFDMTAAFDNVDHQQLLDFVFNTNIPAAIRRWFNNYMQNRRAKVHFRQQESKAER